MLGSQEPAFRYKYAVQIHQKTVFPRASYQSLWQVFFCRVLVIAGFSLQSGLGF